MFYPAEILSLAGRVLIQMNLFLFCTVCQADKNIACQPAAWRREDSSANEADPLTVFPSSPALSIYVSTLPIILLVWASSFKADFPPPKHPSLQPVSHLLYGSLAKCVRLCVRMCKCFLCIATALHLHREKQSHRKEQKETKRCLGAMLGHKERIVLTEDERSHGLWNNSWMKIAHQLLQVE